MTSETEKQTENTKKPEEPKEVFKWRQLCEEKKFGEALVEFVNTRKNKVTIFPEIQDYFKNFMETTGDITIRADKYVILWHGLSEELANVINTLTMTQQLYYHPCNPVYYFAAKKFLYLPPLTAEVGEPSEPHWLVTLLSTEPRKSMRDKAKTEDEKEPPKPKKKSNLILPPGYSQNKDLKKKLILP